VVVGGVVAIVEGRTVVVVGAAVDVTAGALVDVVVGACVVVADVGVTVTSASVVTALVGGAVLAVDGTVVVVEVGATVSDVVGSVVVGPVVEPEPPQLNRSVSPAAATKHLTGERRRPRGHDAPLRASARSDMRPPKCLRSRFQCPNAGRRRTRPLVPDEGVP
jgi:hypothetical protein